MPSNGAIKDEKDSLLFYAKSNGETIKEHTDKVLAAFECLQVFLNLDIREKEIIKKIVEYHDSGKVNPSFQNRIRKILKLKAFDNWDKENIPHEWLSPAFIPQQVENEIRNKIRELFTDEERIFNFFVFVIVSHHNRENLYPDNKLIKEMLNWINSKLNFKTEYYYDVSYLLKTYNTSENREIWNKFFPYRIKWLGSLLKCDYCASAGIEPEIKYNGNYQEDFNCFLKQKSIKLRDFQKISGENSDKSILLVASTGIGKTEAAMNWINGQKAFYLLGIRIAVNEMYNRFKNVFGDNVSLLHGETSFFFAQTEVDEDEHETKIEKARKLSFPLTVATADQIITSVFKYPGFEFTYLTCSYSKIVLDEIQSFSPAAIAAIVVFLKEIHNLGGRFMLMTATLPPFLIEEFKNLENVNIFEPQLIDIKRHKIAIVNEDICSENTFQLLRKNRDKKILIICNTVKKSQEMYNLLGVHNINSFLIHALFIGKDRKEKERDIVSVKSSSIWISTQIVEASLDVDFDLLLTENASIESLLQRFGRCYRKREFRCKEPNIYIFQSQPYKIYDKYLFSKTWEVLQNYNNKIISEQDKQDMINEVFKDIRHTNYFNEYKRQKDLLEIGYRSLSKVEAQQDFREITNNYVVIPEDTYKENEKRITELIESIDNNKGKNKIEILKMQAELFDYSIPIRLYEKDRNRLQDISSSKFCNRHNLKLIKGCEYSKEKGLILNKNEEKDEDFGVIL